MIKRIGKFLLVISSIKKRPLCEERLLFCFKASAFLPGYGFFFPPTPNKNWISDTTNSKIDLTLLIRLQFLIFNFQFLKVPPVFLPASILPVQRA